MKNILSTFGPKKAQCLMCAVNSTTRTKTLYVPYLDLNRFHRCLMWKYYWNIYIYIYKSSSSGAKLYSLPSGMFIWFILYVSFFVLTKNVLKKQYILYMKRHVWHLNHFCYNSLIIIATNIYLDFLESTANTIYSPIIFVWWTMVKKSCYHNINTRETWRVKCLIRIRYILVCNFAAR